jgi:hypothetical protein
MINVSDYVDKTKKKTIITPEPFKAPELKTIGQPTIVPEFNSVSGNNVKSYIDNKSANLGKDPGYTTDAGRLAADRITKGLTAPDASSVNVQNTADTNASRRQYMANLQSSEAIGQSGFGQGTAQAERIRMNAQAGVNSANQEGQNSANEYLRRRTDSNLAAAGQLESQQYNRGRVDLQDAQGQDLQEYGRSETATDRGLAAAATAYGKSRDLIGDAKDTRNFEYSASRDAVGDTRYASETSYNRGENALNRDERNTQREFENAQVLKAGSDSDKRNLINSLPEGPAKNAAIAALGQGKPIAEVLGMVINPDGSLKMVGKDPIATAFEAEKVYAEQTVDLQNDAPIKGSVEYIKRVNDEMLKNRNAKQSPINKEAKAETIESIKSRVLNGEKLTDPDEIKAAVSSGVIPPMSFDTIPVSPEAAQAFKKENPSGQFAINGKVYTLDKSETLRTGWRSSIFGDDPRHTDVATLITPEGKTVYFYNGAEHDKKPKTV